MLDRNRLEQKELDILASGTWGTIGPHSVSAAASLASLVGAQYGLVCHSPDAAYEALLRHFGAARGTSVVVGSVCVPMDALMTVLVGAGVYFCPTCPTCDGIKTDALEAILAANDDICCVMADYVVGVPLDDLTAVCKAHHVPLILNAGGDFGAQYNDKPLADYADAVVYSLEAGSAVYAGKGGFLAMNGLSVYEGAFAYHNCGRAFGAGSSLEMDALVGGDMRVCEWVCAAIEEVLESKTFAIPVPPTRVKMEGQPVFASAYARKMTGR